MKLCLFSDIHGNATAFREAYRKILQESADVNLFLGDLCGYYYGQMEVYELLRAIPNLIALKGNHDAMFLSIRNGDKELRSTYLGKYGTSMERLLEKNTGEFVAWLEERPTFHDLKDHHIAAYHGAPWEPLEGYVYPDTPLDDIKNYPYDLFLLGHTHYPMNRTISSKAIVNPGSLGQPRNGAWPTYAIVETGQPDVEFKQVIYDKSELLGRICVYGERNKYLGKILERN